LFIVHDDVVILVDIVHDAGMWLERGRRTLGFFEGVRGESGVAFGIEVAHAGQGDGDGAKVLSEEVRVPDDPEDGAGELQEMPANWGTMTKSQRRTWKLARARIRKKTQG
jgi:hypothetical protein